MALRSSNPVPLSEDQPANASLTSLETGLRVASTSRTQLTELLPVTNPCQETTVLSNPQTEDDNMSSECEFSALSRNEPKVRFLTDLSESEKTGVEGSLIKCPSLHGRNPVDFQSVTEACDESDANSPSTSLERPSKSTSNDPDDNLPELSGRCRAILKSNFLETDAFNLPRGHPTEAFSEPQVHRLLSVLSDATLRMSFGTIERMVTDAVRRKPTTALSRTAHFHVRGGHKHQDVGLSQTPAPLMLTRRPLLQLGSQAHPVPSGGCLIRWGK